MSSVPAGRSTFATDGDTAMLAVPGAEGEMVRVGGGGDAVTVTAFDVGVMQFAKLSFGFPAVAEAVGTGDSLILCTMLTTPDGGVWEGMPLRAGMTFVYPAGSTHHAADPAGLEFMMAVIPWESVEAASSSLGAGPTEAGAKRVIDDVDWCGTVTSLLVDRSTPDVGTDGAVRLEDAVLDSVVHALAGEGLPVRTNGNGRGLSSADLVWETREFLTATGSWMVPVLSLCRHLGVSERRLQVAFHRVFGVGPHAFMRFRALQHAHRALVEASPSTATVADIARRHGISHLGRFARSHFDVYGELPSATLNDGPR